MSEKYCCEEFEEALDDDFIEENNNDSFDINHDCYEPCGYHTEYMKIKYCPFCGTRLPCIKGEHDYIPVLDERKSVCRICGKVEKS